MNWAWPAAFAFVGMCAAMAYATVYAPVEKHPQVICIEQRGKWVRGGWGIATCEFPPAEKAP